MDSKSLSMLYAMLSVYTGSKKETLHTKFIASNITVCPIFTPITTEEPGEVSATFFFFPLDLFSCFHILRFTTLSIYSALIIQISSLTFYVSARIQSSHKTNLKIRFSKSVNCVKTNTHNQIQRTLEKS